jgi:hypothetical protein
MFNFLLGQVYQSNINTLLKRTIVPQICEVQSDGDNIIIMNAAPDGVDDICDYIRCIFHVVFPGKQNGCRCDLQTEFTWTLSGTSYWVLHVIGCDCFHVVNIVGNIPGRLVPKDRNVWPCQGKCDSNERCDDDICYFAPQIKLITAAK